MSHQVINQITYGLGGPPGPPFNLGAVRSQVILSFTLLWRNTRCLGDLEDGWWVSPTSSVVQKQHVSLNSKTGCSLPSNFPCQIYRSTVLRRRIDRTPLDSLLTDVNHFSPLKNPVRWSRVVAHHHQPKSFPRFWTKRTLWFWTGWLFPLRFPFMPHMGYHFVNPNESSVFQDYDPRVTCQ